MDNCERDSMIIAFHSLGMEQSDILRGLAHYGVIISGRHLRRILKTLKLSRRKEYSDLGEVAVFIQREIDPSGTLHGYRWMFQKCLDSGLKVRKHDVRVILQALDPEGTSIRMARKLHRRTYNASGPNYIWHLDGYDKIKHYGFGIHGCIDGFSRRLIWLNVYSSNNDPKLIAGYYIQAVEEQGGCPRIVRGDRGTENVVVKELQEALMGNQRNGHRLAYISGASTSNQRIESFWGQLRKQCMEFWICLFHSLQEGGDFLGDFIDRSLLQFCFMSIIQTELDKTFEVWNSHKIRKTRTNMPSGRPNIMFEVPAVYQTRSYLTNITHDEINTARELCSFRKTIPWDDDMNELCCLVMNQHMLTFPNGIVCDDYVNLYMQLRQYIRNMLDA